MTRRLCALGAALAAVFIVSPVWAGGCGASVCAGDSTFGPETLKTAVGAQVSWQNVGQLPHEVTAVDGSFASGNIAPGATYTRTFTAAGTFAYYCKYHGTATTGMHATVVVGSGLARTGGGREIQLGLTLVAVTALVGTGLHLTRRTS